MNLEYNEGLPKTNKAVMKDVNNEKLDKKQRLLKSKSRSSKMGASSFSRVLEGQKTLNSPMPSARNKENKSKSKMLHSKAKETASSRRKELRT
jgi:hypothetical protein